MTVRKIRLYLFTCLQLVWLCKFSRTNEKDLQHQAGQKAGKFRTNFEKKIQVSFFAKSKNTHCNIELYQYLFFFFKKWIFIRMHTIFSKIRTTIFPKWRKITTFVYFAIMVHCLLKHFYWSEKIHIREKPQRFSRKNRKYCSVSKISPLKEKKVKKYKWFCSFSLKSDHIILR